MWMHLWVVGVVMMHGVVAGWWWSRLIMSLPMSRQMIRLRALRLLLLLLVLVLLTGH